VQYAFYAGIFGLLTKSPLSDQLARFFIDVSTHDTFPLLAGIYSAILGFFIPSGGGKWILESPYLLHAAIELKVHMGWIVQTYNAAEALPNLINPFWMLPLLGVIGIKARDIVGYSIIQFLVHTPLVLFLIWALAKTFEFIPPNLN
jgi:short-chain fatty acids transporter